MTSNNDATLIWLLGECFRNRLRTLIQVQPVLDHVNFIEREQKDLIINKARTESNQRAADLLIDTIIKKPRPDGWFRELVNALEAGGCKYAAQYVDTAELPPPSLEAENDHFVQLVDLLAPSLITMKTSDVCLMCFAKEILTKEDHDNIMAEVRNNGQRNGARLLLRRIVLQPPGWFSAFLDVLSKSEHHDLFRELTGAETPQELEEMITEDRDTPEALKDQNELKKDEPVEGPEEMELERTSAEESLDGSMGNSSFNSLLDSSIGSTSDRTDLDLYNADAEQKNEKEEGVDESPVSDGGDEGPAAAGATDTDIVLRDYQMEVARPALEGKNIIICLPTGSGKTRVAVYITREHLDARKREGKPGKVVVLVNKVPLVEQHYSTEFGKYLKRQYHVERVSGNSQLKISFPDIVRKNDIIICTAQILENAFSQAKSKEEGSIHLSDFSLVVIDECHHTQKGEVYNHIMIRFLRQKLKNELSRKQQSEPVPLPQILGLTASPGVGGAKNMHKAEEHILKICANLDAFKIMTGRLGDHEKEPYKKIATAEERKEDPFGDMIKGIMDEIHSHAELQPPCNPGTQNYEQWVVQKEQQAAKEKNQKVRVCAEHLRQYNEALHQSNTLRMSDAFSFLRKYHDEELKKKTAPEDEEEAIELTETDRFLFRLFRDKKRKLEDVAKKPEYENKILSTLKQTVLREFTSRQEARGIIFTKTRLGAMALHQWILENKKFEEVGVSASYLIGGGDQSVVKPMTSKEQKDVLEKFRKGEINLLIATTVAEEGLDIKECNFVIRYCLVTNEIAMIQARGRGRAGDSSYTLVEVEGSGVSERESVNEYREQMMSKAIRKIQNLERKEYESKVREFQMQAIVEKKVHAVKKKQKVMLKDDPSKVRFSCRNCSRPVCSGKDIEIMADMHHVNVTDEFKELFIVRENMTLQERLLDYEVNGDVACKACGYKWGSMMLFKGIDCPCLHIKNFVVTYDNKQKTYNKWSELAVRFPPFDFHNHPDLIAGDSDSD
ncbi:interferon-induced helicase C domain-containing protein 1 [Megalops cyprinoides]|uniref:interferon-induced helicase C domain-containing protein 1 n=1 Tax=Megalops cyprinoides TaxID=118141 RepID=UPI001864CE51|nr:interferon-induced helicase C domain-containing protein 1 [Megalops cyprinoides]